MPDALVQGFSTVRQMRIEGRVFRRCAPFFLSLALLISLALDHTPSAEPCVFSKLARAGDDRIPPYQTSFPVEPF